MATTQVPGEPKPVETTEFDRRVGTDSQPGLFCADRLTTIQVNVGLRCNLSCRHCHVNSSPKRKEEMDWPTMEAVLGLADALHPDTIDITGGAPEMNPHLKPFIRAIHARGMQAIVRTNLTILLEPGYEDFISFFREHEVQVVASLPCYLEENVEQQRGEGVYAASIEAIRKLNEAGYGVNPGLVLNLIYNPVGPSLPPDQASLEVDYRRELSQRFGIGFTNLHTITNVPIGRFKTDLKRSGTLTDYEVTLRRAFNRDTVEGLMCRHQVSVAWDGALYDCDFNLALRWPVGCETQPNVRTIDPATLPLRRVETGAHCYACAAGSGSSCGGTLV